MADYRLSSQIITRSSGKSAVAAAAYRAGDRLNDERTGVRHDYSRKGGVQHSEILAPANTPDWMHNREKLWNAVEAVEKRKNSQLAREIQLSLPHELTPEQRTKLVQDFVLGQFVERGMIADVSIHAPNPKGDERNHHAHIMLTMRELTGDGFHSKKATPTARSWNDKDLLTTWREKWAEQQNLTLERHGHSERVDHRSYEAQGIDREPEQHRGTAANDMLAKGKQSRIDEENKAIQQRNAERASQYARNAQQAATMSRKTQFEQAANRVKEEKLSAFAAAKKDMEARHQLENNSLQQSLAENGRATVEQEANSIEKRLEATGFKKVIRDVTLQTSKDTTSLAELQLSIKQIKHQEEQQKFALEVKQKQEREQLQQQQRELLEAKQTQQQQQTEQAKSRSTQGRGDSASGGYQDPQRRQTDKPQPEPPPPREALSIAQQWGEKSGQNAAAVEKATKNRTIDTSKMAMGRDEKPKEFERRSGGEYDNKTYVRKEPTDKPEPEKKSIADQWKDKKASRSNDNPPREQSLEPNRDLKPKGFTRDR